MALIKYVLLTATLGLFLAAAAVLVIDAYRVLRSLLPPPVRWRLATRLVLFAWLPLMPVLSIVIVPDGMDGVLVSQIPGTLAGTLSPGTHLIVPLIHHVELYAAREAEH